LQFSRLVCPSPFASRTYHFAWSFVLAFPSHVARFLPLSGNPTAQFGLELSISRSGRPCSFASHPVSFHPYPLPVSFPILSSRTYYLVPSQSVRSFRLEGSIRFVPTSVGVGKSLPRVGHCSTQCMFCAISGFSRLEIHAHPSPGLWTIVTLHRPIIGGRHGLPVWVCVVLLLPSSLSRVVLSACFATKFLEVQSAVK